MFLVNQAMVDLQIGTAGLVALLGYAVVFVGLIALMVVILIEGKFAVAKDQKTEAPKAAAPAAPAPVSKELETQILGEGGKPVDCRIEDAKRTGEDFKKAKEENICKYSIVEA